MATTPRRGRPQPGPGLPQDGGAAPPRYIRRFVEQVRQAANVGFTITELARLLGVHIDTVNLWVMVYPEFAAAMRSNDQARRDRVEAALYQRAVGYVQPGEKIVKTSDDEIVRVPIVTHIPADTQAALSYLKAWDPDRYAKSTDADTANVLRVVIENDPDAGS